MSSSRSLSYLGFPFSFVGKAMMTNSDLWYVWQASKGAQEKTLGAGTRAETPTKSAPTWVFCFSPLSFSTSPLPLLLRPVLWIISDFFCSRTHSKTAPLSGSVLEHPSLEEGGEVGNMWAGTRDESRGVCTSTECPCLQREQSSSSAGNNSAILRPVNVLCHSSPSSATERPVGS